MPHRFAPALIAAATVLAGCGTPGPTAATAAEPSRAPGAAAPPAASAADAGTGPADPESPPPADPPFWSHWGDGHAEMNAYDLTQSRYGALRPGRAVLIFVTEPFSEELRVKADPGHPPGDIFQALKLNFVRDFQTGVYDYNVMTSTFVRTETWEGRPRGTPAKISFSAQEWCGNVYAHALFDPASVRLSGHSYFEKEVSESRPIDFPAGGLTEDALPIAVRGLFGPWLEPGQSVTVPLLPSFLYFRFQHVPVAWTTATITRAAGTETITVPMGTFVVATIRVTDDLGRTTTYFIETAHPHKLVKWQGADGETGALRGSTRMKYWELNQPGGERHLADFGLPVPGP